MNYRLIDFDNYLKDHVSAGTRKLYIHDVGVFLDKYREHDVGVEEAQEYIDSLKSLSPSTVAIIAHGIMRWFKWKGTPIDLDIPTVRTPNPEYISLEQFRVLLGACRSAVERLLLVLLFDTGARISEILNLKLADVHYDMKTVTVTRKGGKIQDVNVSDDAMNDLSNWIESRNLDSPKIFGEMNYQDAWKLIKEIGLRVKIDLHPHMLRHSRAIQMLKAGAPMHIVQQHLGHINIATTANIYGRFNTADLRPQIPVWNKT
jgi:integrase